MIEQGRKGSFERMMFYALGHRVDSFVGDQNEPKKSPLDIPRRAVAAAGLSYAVFGRKRPHRYGQPSGAAPTGQQFTEGMLHQLNNGP
jgi:hypothetical protein